jgi:hypothetical protein
MEMLEIFKNQQKKMKKKKKKKNNRNSIFLQKNYHNILWEQVLDMDTRK